MFTKGIFFNSDAGQGGGGAAPVATPNGQGAPAAGGAPAGQPQQPEFYTKEQYEEARARSYSSGLNEARARDIKPLIAKAREMGFNIDDLNDTTFGEIITHAQAHVKNAKFNEQAARDVEAAKTEINRYKGLYEGKVIDSHISQYLKDVIDLQDTLKLIGSEMKFRVDIVDGKEVVKVLAPDGSTLKKDAWTDYTAEEAVKDFLTRKPHLVQPSGRSAVPTGSRSQGGVIIDGRSLEEIINKPSSQWTKNDNALIYKALNDGKIRYDNRQLVIVQ